LVPIFLVFGAYFRISELDLPAPNITQRAIVIRKAIIEIAKLRAKRVVNNVLYYYNGLDTVPVHDLPLNSKVLV
jgi:hypothetical protein